MCTVSKLDLMKIRFNIAQKVHMDLKYYDFVYGLASILTLLDMYSSCNKAYKIKWCVSTFPTYPNFLCRH